MSVTIFYLIGGILFLYLGAEGLVRGSTSLAFRLGLTRLVIGLTIVAFGTSSPEMVVSVKAALDQNGAISLGNVIGSNICNIALILGLVCPCLSCSHRRPGRSHPNPNYDCRIIDLNAPAPRWETGTDGRPGAVCRYHCIHIGQYLYGQEGAE